MKSIIVGSLFAFAVVAASPASALALRVGPRGVHVRVGHSYGWHRGWHHGWVRHGAWHRGWHRGYRHW